MNLDLNNGVQEYSEQSNLSCILNQNKFSKENIFSSVIGDKKKHTYVCTPTNSKKVLLTSNNDNIGTTQVQRIVNIIKYSNGGKTNFGLSPTQSSIIGTPPIKNKF